MIARFKVLLPYQFHLRSGDELVPFELVAGAYAVRVHPPLQCKWAISMGLLAAGPVELDEVARLDVVQPPIETGLFLLKDRPSIVTDLLQVDFLKPDFDRRDYVGADPEHFWSQKELDHGDPSITFAFDVVNDILARFRLVTRGLQIKPVTPFSTWWRLEYLTDEAQELQPDPHLLRGRASMVTREQWCGMTADTWQAIASLSADFVPATWDTLLLDARSLLPDVGASIAVANAALETFIAWALDELAVVSRLDPTLWQWINSRGHFLQEPSTDDQYDMLLRVLTGRSLKDEPRLWGEYRELRRARNSFIHAGTAMATGKHGKAPVTSARASDLAYAAGEIVAWVETLLPPSLRRPVAEEVHPEVPEALRLISDN